MHTILGAGGIIADGLTRELLARGETVRLVSRRAPPFPGASAVSADLTDPDATIAAVRGARVAYLVAGLPYRSKVWEEQWPRIMRNTIEACKRAGARLVFFDNVYAYGRVDGPMTEATPFNPCSHKGEVRAGIAMQLLDEVNAGALTAMIARAPDFYGPNCANSLVNLFVINKLATGARALWPGNDAMPHSLIFTPDAARAVALLAAKDEAWRQTWHLPTAAPAPTGREFVAQTARALGVPARNATLGRFMFRLAGLFNADARESVEMLYQYENPYRFDSAKFERGFSFAPTSYADGIRETTSVKRSPPAKR